MDVFILMGERGEYTDRVETNYGAFASLPDALAAHSRTPGESAAGWAAYQALEQRAKEIAIARGFPRPEKEYLKMTKEELAAYNAHRDTVRAVEAELGGKPNFYIACTEYWVLRFELGALAPDGVEVWRSPEAAKAA